jgi:hypothetical protein
MINKFDTTDGPGGLTITCKQSGTTEHCTHINRIRYRPIRQIGIEKLIAPVNIPKKLSTLEHVPRGYI